jgi:hypothetical protein
MSNISFNAGGYSVDVIRKDCDASLNSSRPVNSGGGRLLLDMKGAKYEKGLVAYYNLLCNSR